MWGSTPMTIEPHDAALAPGRVSQETLFAGSGEMAARCRLLDWAATPLGAVEQWPVSLRTVAALVASAAYPMALLWGDACAQIYSDGYGTLLGASHPTALGQSNKECWPEQWTVLAPVYERVREGERVTLEDVSLPLDRARIPADTRFGLDFAPVRDDAGLVTGVLVSVSDATSHRRALALVESLAATAQVRGRRELERLLTESREAQDSLAEANSLLEDKQVELELGNQQLQDNAVELEAQTEELRDAVASLAERTKEAEAATRRARFAGDVGRAITANVSASRIGRYALSKGQLMNTSSA